MQIIKRTSLSKATDIKDTLEWKLSTIVQGNKQFAIVDYVGRAFGELDALKAYHKQLVKEAQADVKKIEAQEALIKKGVFEFFTDNGMTSKDDLKGEQTSSIRLNAGSEPVTKMKREFVLSITQEDMENTLIDLGLASYVDKEVTSKGKDHSITVFKRKTLVPEIE